MLLILCGTNMAIAPLDVVIDASIAVRSRSHPKLAGDLQVRIFCSCVTPCFALLYRFCTKGNAARHG
jgi:hypothetical protein